jgi:hypothetical protein
MLTGYKSIRRIVTAPRLNSITVLAIFWLIKFGSKKIPMKKRPRFSFLDEMKELPKQFKQPNILPVGIVGCPFSQPAIEQDKGLAEFVAEFLGISERPEVIILLRETNSGSSDPESFVRKFQSLCSHFENDPNKLLKESLALLERRFSGLSKVKEEFEDSAKICSFSFKDKSVKAAFIFSKMPNETLRRFAHEAEGIDVLVHMQLPKPNHHHEILTLITSREGMRTHERAAYKRLLEHARKTPDGFHKVH